MPKVLRIALNRCNKGYEGAPRCVTSTLLVLTCIEKLQYIFNFKANIKVNEALN